MALDLMAVCVYNTHGMIKVCDMTPYLPSENDLWKYSRDNNRVRCDIFLRERNLYENIHAIGVGWDMMSCQPAMYACQHLRDKKY